MSKKINDLKSIDEETALLWKQETITYLKTMKPVPEQMETDLMGTLRPKRKPKCYLLLEPDQYHTEAFYLRAGMVKLFIIDSQTGKPQIMHIWVAGEIVVLYKLFRNRLLNTKYYLELITAAELVSISIDAMDSIYADHVTAERLTTDILAEKSERRLKQMELLSIEIKADRYARFVELFPELANRLCNDDLCAFLGISRPTLISARAEWLKRKK